MVEITVDEAVDQFRDELNTLVNNCPLPHSVTNMIMKEAVKQISELEQLHRIKRQQEASALEEDKVEDVEAVLPDTN